MRIYRGFRDKRINPKPRCIAIGVFDGVHRGHQKIIARAVKTAKRIHASSMAITFDPHPNQILKPQARHSVLMSVPYRLKLLEKLGVNEALVIHFNERFSKISHRFFLDELLCRKLGMSALSVGEDFRFGFHGLGNARYLSAGAKRLGFKLFLAKPLKVQRETVSSTHLRRLIENGRLKKAGQMLGRPVSVYGTVAHGRGRGNLIGFPTANLKLHHETLPPNGVYAAWGLWNRKRFKAVIHVGKRPTFNDRQKSIEAYFLNFHKNIYGAAIELFFMERLRGTRKFGSLEALTWAIHKDVQTTLKILVNCN